MDQNELDQWHSELDRTCKAGLTPHSSNLRHQLQPEKVSKAKIATALEKVLPAYITWVDTITAHPIEPINELGASLTNALEEYLTLLRTPECAVFSSVSDFLTSVVPEAFLRVFDLLIDHRGSPLEASGQKNIPIDIAFDLQDPKLIVPKNQRVDIAVVKKATLVADGNEFPDFCIPVFAAEAKTYFDKNMISGVDFSVNRMKSTYRNCKYFAIGEWSDFNISAQSYAASPIDEIYILRRQKRSEFRKTGKMNPICEELVTEIISEVDHCLRHFETPRSDLSVRLEGGRLVSL